MALAAIGAVLSLVCIGIAAGALHSERFAERVGAFVERLVTWARGIAHRPSDTDLAEVIVRFRADTIETVRGAGVTLVGVILLKYVATGVTLLVSLRAVGVPDDALSVAGVFAAYAVVRLVTVVEITPGGVGVVEVAYIAALTYVTGDAYHAEIVAGVLLFRVVTYIAPIATGAICYLIWRRKRSWRVDVATDEPSDLEVVSALVDERPPPDEPRE